VIWEVCWTVGSEQPLLVLFAGSTIGQDVIRLDLADESCTVDIEIDEKGVRRKDHAVAAFAIDALRIGHHGHEHRYIA
jgi:hypothetical protein